ncbi:unnamed protein product [Bursaphelenchus okinawaensis]|uniref:Uncharacterized protein n=1 Tax=Bursaphelenchus okinawaensis TaxID=465554 RepID=A0A811KBW9_9BILA|nr:unnamed protein product [Bursaphelenchus okinawaensis]CAG9101234.1 unnamed protein product [Bursaphelenchus okinawaensis]
MPTHPDQSKSKANKLKKLANFISQTVQFINFPVVRVLVDEKLKLLPEKWLAEHKKMDIGNVASCSREKLAENEEKGDRFGIKTFFSKLYRPNIVIISPIPASG